MHILFIYIYFIHTYISESSVGIETTLQCQCMIEQIPFITEFMQMCMIITESKSIVARILQVIIMIFPTCFVKRSFARHIEHTTFRRFLCSIVPIAIILPISIVCINICSIYIIHLICLEMMRSVHLYYFTVYAYHILA